jgi:hypothetical protein
MRPGMQELETLGVPSKYSVSTWAHVLHASEESSDTLPAIALITHLVNTQPPGANREVNTEEI